MTDRPTNGAERCTESECERPASVRLYIPWDDDRNVCASHARALVQQKGVVAVPLEGDDSKWP